LVGETADVGVVPVAEVGVTVVAAFVGVVALVGETDGFVVGSDVGVADGDASVGSISIVGVAWGVTRITRSDALSSGIAEIIRCEPK
jgi:hypothetical protein